MVNGIEARAGLVSVILPASNEAALIGDCLEALLASRWDRSETVEVIVVANGCRDNTANLARGFAVRFKAQNWGFYVTELVQGGKLGALNAGDAKASGAIRVYLDADVTVSPGLLSELTEALSTDEPRYASGKVEITAKSPVSRAYARIWRQVPFMAECVPGCGVFAVNAAGRNRWGTFPDIISDDTFVRLSFAPEERIGVSATYRWPIAEGLRNLIRVRRRQDVGVDEIAQKYPARLANDDKPDFPRSRKMDMALGDPFGFAVYAGVALVVKLTKGQTSGWSRSR